MPNPYPDLIVDSKRFNWTGATNPAQHRIAAPLVNAAGDIWVSPFETLGGTVSRELMKISGATKEKLFQIVHGVGIVAENYGIIVADGRIFYNQDSRFNRYDADGLFEIFSGAGDATRGFGNNISQRGTGIYFQGRNTTNTRPARLDINTMAFSYGAIGGTWTSPAMTYDPVADKFFAQSNGLTIARYNGGTLAVDGSYNTTFNGWEDVHYFDGHVYAAGITPGRIIKINTTTMTLAGTIIGPYQCITSNGRHIFAVKAVVNDDQIDIIDPVAFTVEHTIAEATMPGKGGGAASQKFIKYDPVFNRIILADAVNENQARNNLAFIDLEPGGPRPRRSGTELWQIIPELGEYLI